MGILIIEAWSWAGCDNRRSAGAQHELLQHLHHPLLHAVRDEEVVVEETFLEQRWR